jgi:UDP-GlcNAc:undecaprenyl-phosphate GlcNAc-1-phosphate transferase
VEFAVDLRLISLLLVSFATALAVTPIARRLGASLGLLDHPHARKVQSAAVPRTGGIGILAGLAAGVAALAALAGGLGVPLGREVAAICVGGVLIHVVGVVDDLWDIPAPAKLLAQSAAVGIVVSSGVVLRQVSFGPDASLSLGPFAVPLTAFLLLGFVNALNLVDGLDGLASGVAAVCALVMALAGVLNGNVVMAAFALPLLGSVLGFLPFNVGRGRKTFLGDAGSTLLGYALAVTAISGARFAHGDATPVLVAFVGALIPIFDTATTIVRRFRTGQGLFRPDSMHLHHRLIRFGLTPQRTVAALLCTTLALSCQLLAYLIDGLYGLHVVSLLAAGLVVVWIRRPRVPASEDADAGVREILLYLLGAQDGGTPRLRGELAIVDVLAVDGRPAAPAARVGSGRPDAPEEVATAPE